MALTSLVDQTLVDEDAPAPASARVAEPPRRGWRPVTSRRADVLTMGASLFGSFALTWLCFTRLLPFNGLLGFLLCWFAVFLAMNAAANVVQFGPLVAADRTAAAVLFTGAALVFGVLATVVGYIAVKGYTALQHANFFTETLSVSGPLAPLSSGGILHAFVGSMQQLGLGVLFSVPLGIATAIFLSEIGGPLARWIRLFVDTMTALPSIVAGLFILATFILTWGFDRSGIAAAMAISVMMLPIVVRATETVLRLVPGGLREAAYALGSSQWRVVWNVVLPTSRSGLATAIVLAMARGVGETSPVLLTAGYTAELNANPFSGPQVNLPLFTFIATSFAQPEMIARGFGAGLALLVAVLVLFTVARAIGGRARV